MSNIKALIFILKSIIDLGMYLTKKINHDQYVGRLKEMDDHIYKASNGELGTRLEAGQNIEDQFNRRVGPH